MTRSACLAALGAALALPAGAAARPFTPAGIAGTYSGTWDNRTFDVQGTFAVTFSAKGRTLVVSGPVVNGGAFGCSSVTFPPGGWSLPKGGGANHWNGDGFRLRRSGDFGTFDIRYNARTGALRGTGKAPPSCAAGVTYKIAGWLKGKRLNGTATIDLGNRTASTVFMATRG